MFSIYNADCLTKLKDISSNSVDLVICDLPFGCLTGGGGQEKKQRRLKRYVDGVIAGCPWDIKIDLEEFWKEIKRIRKDNHTPTIHFCTTKYGYELIKSNEKEFRYDLVWDKSRGVSFLSANKMPMRSHEMVYVFSKLGANYNRIDIKGDFKAYIKKEGGTENKTYNTTRLDSKNDGGTRCVKSVIQAPNGTFKKNQHPTEKPLELYKFLIERYSKEGDTVLDPTFGSGNSGLACKELKRNYIGIEKDKDFFEKFQKKISDKTDVSNSNTVV